MKSIQLIMLLTKKSIEKQRELYGANCKEKKKKFDHRIETLLYRKSKLESTSETSAVISGFAIVALVEFSIDSYPDIPSRGGVLTAYTIVSCLLVSIHLLALLMSICILPEVKSVIRRRKQWIKNSNEEPLSSIAFYVEIAWILSTGFGLFMIILEIGLVFWIKVAGFSIRAAITAIVTLCFIGFPFIIFAVGFYIRIIRAKVILQKNNPDSIERGAAAVTLFMTQITSHSSSNSVAGTATTSA